MNDINCDVSKEFLTFLYYFDNELIKLIPTQFIKKITKLASESNKEFYVKKNKKLFEQEMSDSCKKLIMYIYYKYLLD